MLAMVAGTAAPWIKDSLSLAFRWQSVGQESGYDKMLLLTARWPLRCDSYLIKYPQAPAIPPQLDPACPARPCRPNIVLKASASGGEFVCAAPIFQTHRINSFGPTFVHIASRKSQAVAGICCPPDNYTGHQEMPFGKPIIRRSDQFHGIQCN
jgi:hypothetical protein